MVICNSPFSFSSLVLVLPLNSTGATIPTLIRNGRKMRSRLADPQLMWPWLIRSMALTKSVAMSREGTAALSVTWVIPARDALPFLLRMILFSAFIERISLSMNHRIHPNFESHNFSEEQVMTTSFNQVGIRVETGRGNSIRNHIPMSGLLRDIYLLQGWTKITFPGSVNMR